MTNGDERGVRVSTLELFFDLVFVFTLTQLTGILAKDFDLEGIVQVALMLGIIFWMYGGYAWLTNAVAPDRALKRLVLIGGMGAYLILALAIPEAFDSTGLAFGLAYLLIVLIHSGLFAYYSKQAILTLAPYNLLSAAIVIAGGAIGGTAQYVLWALAFALEWVTPKLIDQGTFEIAPSHFVERHGLVVIVAIGESIVAIGIGAAGLDVDLELVVAATSGLALSACLWWAHFGGEDERAEEALTLADPAERPRLAINAFGYAHILILLGIIAVAAAEKQVIAHALDPLEGAAALYLAGGLAVFLLGDAVFRRSLRISRIDLRLAAAALAFATIPIGTEGAALAQLAALVALMVGVFGIERRIEPAWSPA
jgi:low temperature requirement protein LtrA